MKRNIDIDLSQCRSSQPSLASLALRARQDSLSSITRTAAANRLIYALLSKAEELSKTEKVSIVSVDTNYGDPKTLTLTITVQR